MPWDSWSHVTAPPHSSIHRGPQNQVPPPWLLAPGETRSLGSPSHPLLGHLASHPKQKIDTNPAVLISSPSNPRDVSRVLRGRIWPPALAWALPRRFGLDSPGSRPVAGRGRLQVSACSRSLRWGFSYTAQFTASFCLSWWENGTERCFLKNAKKSFQAVPL